MAISQQDVIKGLTEKNLAWMWEYDLPNGYKINPEIPMFMPQSFELGKRPIILNGSRVLMWTKYRNRHTAARHLIWERFLRLYKITHFISDIHGETRQAKKRHNHFIVLRDRIFTKLSDRYYSSRFWIYGGEYNILHGKIIYGEIDDSIIEFLNLSDKLLTNLNKLESLSGI